jgi:hypothetical protein
MPAAAHEPGETPAHETGASPSPAPLLAGAPDVVTALRTAAPGARRELVHQLQRTAGNAAVGRLLRQPAPSTLPPLPRTPSFRERLETWHRMRGSSMPTPAERRAAAEAAVNALNDHEDVMRDGIALVRELFEDGFDDLAQRALDRVETGWVVQAVIAPRDDSLEEIRRTSVPSASFIGSVEGMMLIDRARQAARDGNHQLVFALLTRAALFIQMQILREGEIREAQLRGLTERAGGDAHAMDDFADITRAMILYPVLGSLYGQLRSIMAFYPELERERRAAGDTAGVAQMQTLGAALRQGITDRYTWSGHAMIAEVTQVETRRGPGLRLHGANVAETDLTQLPGLPSPREVGTHTYQWQETGDILRALAGQVDLVEELRADPEVARAFPSGEIDMGNDAQRMRVWTAMFRSLRARGPDDAAAIDALIALMQRYLKAFTIHTSYNVRDWGTNYLDSTMPSDLAGRAERDCGVYALTTAFDLFRLARAASPRLSLRFELMSMPEHVTLIIHDSARNRFFVANNDNITGPFTGSVEGEVARQYVGIRGHQNMVVPAVSMELGSTGESESRFRNQSWQRYLDAVSWEIASPPGRREETYQAMYQAEQEFDTGTSQLETALNALVAARAPADERTRLRDGLAALAARYRRLALIFETLGPAAPITADASRPGIAERLRGRKRFLFHSATPGAVHPLARAGMGLLRLRSLGETLSADDDAFLARLNRISDFNAALADYQRRNLPSQF